MSDVEDFATSLDLKTDIILCNLLKMKLSCIQSFSYGNNEVACIYLNRGSTSLIISIKK